MIRSPEDHKDVDTGGDQHPVNGVSVTRLNPCGFGEYEWEGAFEINEYCEVDPRDYTDIDAYARAYAEHYGGEIDSELTGRVHDERGPIIRFHEGGVVWFEMLMPTIIGRTER